MGLETEAVILYNCAKLFGFTPQQTRELDTEEYAMLVWAAEQENKEQEKANKGKGHKPAPRGGSSADGETISSAAQLVAMANKR